MKYSIAGALVVVVGLIMVGSALNMSTAYSVSHAEGGVGHVAILPKPMPEARETVWSAYISRQMDGIAEFKVVGGRVDVLTDTTAWEVEWAGKHDEAIGQAIRYSMSTGRRGGIILLMGRDDAEKEAVSYWICVAAAQRCDLAIRAYNVKKGKWWGE